MSGAPRPDFMDQLALKLIQETLDAACPRFILIVHPTFNLPAPINCAVAQDGYPCRHCLGEPKCPGKCYTDLAPAPNGPAGKPPERARTGDLGGPQTAAEVKRPGKPAPIAPPVPTLPTLPDGPYTGP